MRHAKSDWNTGAADHARPLNARGRREAPFIGRHLKQRDWRPEAVLVSDAARTIETWHCIWGEFPRLEPQERADLYLASAHVILEAAAGLPAAAGCALLIGHNPGMSTAASYLAADHIGLKTATAALFEHPDDDWRCARDAAGWRLVDVVRARTLVDSTR